MTITENPYDLPFALFYLVDPGERYAECVGRAGLECGTPASPTTVDLHDHDGRHLGAGQVSYADVDETGEIAIRTGLE